MESPSLVLTLGLTAFILLFQQQAQAGNEDVIQLVNKQNEKIHQLTETVLELQEKTTRLELEVKTVKQRQEEDAKKFNDIILKQQVEMEYLQEKVLLCQEQRTETEFEIREVNKEVVFKR